MRHPIHFLLVGRVTIALSAAAGLTACGGSFSQSVPESGAGGGGGAGGAANLPDSGAGSGDATVLIDGNDSRCPPTAPATYTSCSSDQFICDYVDGQGCPRRFMCLAMGGVVTGVTGVGGAYPGLALVWIAQSPMVGDSCGTPGKVCSYPESWPSRLICTEDHVWEASSSTTTEGTTSTTTIGSSSVTTNGSTSFTAGGQGGASDMTGSGGMGGAGSASDPAPN